jgi:hypothetical protein
MARRWSRLALAVILGFGAAIGPVHGDTVYTWHEDDGQNVTGSLVVNPLAQSQGFITPNLIDSFVFNVDGGGFGAVYGAFPSFTQIPVSQINGGFTGSVGTRINASGDIGGGYVYTDLNYAVSGGEQWLADFIFNPNPITGVGHWTISIGSVPEPSTWTLALIGLACVAGLKALTRQHGRRHEPPSRLRPPVPVSVPRS